MSSADIQTAFALVQFKALCDEFNVIYLHPLLYLVTCFLLFIPLYNPDPILSIQHVNYVVDVCLAVPLLKCCDLRTPDFKN